jgi:hypothetical protein
MSMDVRRMWGGVLVVATLATPVAVRAQTATSMKDAQVQDLKTMKEKFAGLANAIPQDKWDWRPMDGTRSVKDVLALMVAEGNLFPRVWGTPAAQGTGANFGEEVGRASALQGSALVAEMNKAFDHMIASVQGMDDGARMKGVKFFGQDTDAGTAVGMAATDMHEHLGQLIAYARMNQVVPPWSRGM